MSVDLVSYTGFGYFFGGNDNKEYREGYDKSLYDKLSNITSKLFIFE